jgi:diguanylate cyclase (GGDEF)-like protein
MASSNSFDRAYELETVPANCITTIQGLRVFPPVRRKVSLIERRNDADNSNEPERRCTLRIGEHVPTHVDIVTAFFSTQLDFILFFYGLSFILLGTTCFAISRIDGRPEAWTVLGLFGFVHGGSEWLDLTAMVISPSLTFDLVRLTVMTTSFVLLMEFARREALRFGLKTPGPWLYIPLLALVAAGGVIFGVEAASAFARYVFGFFGALATSLVFARLAQTYSGLTKRLAMCAAAGFVAYAVVAGAIVPTGKVWPTNVINYDWFTHLTGVPIQLVRGTLACWLAFSIWSIWGQNLISDVSSARYTRFMRRQFILTLIAMAAILVAGWTLTECLGQIYEQSVQQKADGDIDLLASRLRAETTAVDGMVKALAGSPSILPLLDGGSGSQIETAKSVVDLNVDASNAALGFILDRNGKVVAASSGGHAAKLSATTAGSLIPDSVKSVAGEAGSGFAFDPRSRGLDYYASYPIRNRGAAVGTAVLQKGLGRFAADLRRFDHPYFLIDPDGVVLLTNRPDTLLRTLWPLSAEQSSRSARQFGELIDRPLVQNEIADATWINFGGVRGFARRRAVGDGGWSLVMLTPIQEIYASRVLGIVITLLVAVMTLIYLFGKERWFHDSIQMERRLQLQNLAQDLRFQATTDPLTGLFNRLKFDQTLSIEMSRSGRYGTPMCLVLYDVDHFKDVNDTYGHQVGDKVLTQLSRVVSGNIRDCDVLARWGGEEFILMLPGCDAQMAHAAVEKLRTVVTQVTFDIVGNVTCSFGIAECVEGDTAEALIARADDALYRAKIKGRNRVEIIVRSAEAGTQTSSAQAR